MKKGKCERSYCNNTGKLYAVIDNDKDIHLWLCKSCAEDFMVFLRAGDTIREECINKPYRKTEIYEKRDYPREKPNKTIPKGI